MGVTAEREPSPTRATQVARQRRAQAVRAQLPGMAMGLLYLLLALGAIAVTRGNEGYALIWPVNAVIASLLIRLPRVNWWGTAASLAVAGTLANRIGAGDAWSLATALTAVNLFEIGAMVLLFRRLLPLPYPRLSINQATRMTLIMGIVVTGLAALPGAYIVHSTHGTAFWPTFLGWWRASALGACVFSPPIILYSQEAMRRLLRPRYAVPNVLTLAGCMTTTAVAMLYLPYPFVIIALCPMVAAFGIGGLGTAILSAANALVIVGLWIPDLASLPFTALIAAAMPPIAVGLGTDARRRVAAALRSSERRFRESMEHSPLGMIILDRNGQWSYSNPAMRNMLGYAEDELLELGIESLAHPEEMHDVWAHWGQLLSQQIDSYKITRRFRHKDGSWIWTVVAVSLARDADGLPMHFVAQVENLQERRQAEANLAAERERLRITLAAISEAVLSVDQAGHVTYMNDAAIKLLGRPFVMVRGRLLAEVLVFTDVETSMPATQLLEHAREQGTPQQRREPCALARPDGSVRFVTETITPLLDEAQQPTSFIVVVHDVTISLENTRDLRHRADHDPLTNLMNRAAFERSLHQAFAHARRTGAPTTLVALDLDRFKEVNDTGGHAAGDAVLRHVAAVLQRSVRPSDVVGRLGGDEFMVLLNNCDPDRAGEVGQRLLQALNPLCTDWDDVAYASGASLGVAQYSPVFKDPDEWAKAADEACYASKRSGRSALSTWKAA